MEVKDLKNYGKSLNTCWKEIPDKIKKEAKKISMKIMRNHLGLKKMASFGLKFSKERKRLLEIDLSKIREKGDVDEEFINMMIDGAAMYIALTEFVGKEKTLEINKEITEATAIIIMSKLGPSAEDLKTFDNPLLAFKEWLLELYKMDKKEGIHDFEAVEENADVFQMNVTYCAYAEIPKLLGAPEAALASCYSDEIFFPSMLKPLGIQFLRKGTLARGDKYCDFRFENLKNQ